MTPERWQQIRDVLERALELAPGERSAYLNQACAFDPSLRQEVETLLASSPDVRSGFLESSALRVTLTSGTKLGEYEVKSLLGSGGMGEVYRARDSRLGRDVAIKVLPSFLSADSSRLRRFEQEARAAAALNHPNILAVFQMGTYEGAPYMVSELLEGETLREQIRRGRLAVRKAIDYGVQTARGLAAAHEKGIVHRDLKPENLFVTKDGRVKILDFGLAKLTQMQSSSEHSAPTFTEGTEVGVVMGTVGYMAPEQVRGQTADHRADIFAFGAILYEMLAGKRAFQKSTSPETMTAILNEDPPGISQITTNIPPAMQRVVHRCLEKNPEQRFQSASDLAFALDALSESSSSASGVVAQESHRIWSWIATAGIAVAIVSLVVWWRLPTPVAVVESVTQLTDDGEPKFGRLATDGSRIYFAEGVPGSFRVAQVSAAGGRTSTLPIDLDNPQVASLSADGSTLLVLSGSPNQSRYSLWSVPLPTGDPRRLGDLEAQDAAFMPDGRIVLAGGTSLYVAEKSGWNPRKIFSSEEMIDSVGVSPGGNRIAFTTKGLAGPHVSTPLWETAEDGKKPREVFRWRDSHICCAKWTPDGRHIVFRTWHDDALVGDLWAARIQTGVFRQSPIPFALTNGPLSFTYFTPSRDGKQVFAIGAKRRGELVRYDEKSHQFVPYLSGISAIDPTFSSDGRWVAYLSYPDHALWRSRTDGTERSQLTYPPVTPFFPAISPDGRKVAFLTPDFSEYVVGIDGRTPQKIAEHAWNQSWSPDGNTLILNTLVPGEKDASQLERIDLATGSRSIVPGSRDMNGALWQSPTTIVAGSPDSKKLLVFDFRTEKWADIASGVFVTWSISPDRRYIYGVTGGMQEPTLVRIRLADSKTETIANFRTLRRAMDPVEGSYVSIAPDGSPVFTRDIGTQEIYALTVKWP